MADSNKATRDRAMVWMGYIITVGFFGYVIGISFWNVSAAMDKVLLGAILGTLGSQFTQVVSYYFGTSKGSADKSELMAAGQVTIPAPAKPAEAPPVTP